MYGDAHITGTQGLSKPPGSVRFSSSTTPKMAVVVVAIVLAGIAWSTG